MGSRQATLAAVGDIVCDPTATPSLTTCQDAATAALITAVNPDKVLVLGDLQYTTGTLAAFMSEYDPVWGAFKAKTLPVPGNHEYYTAGAAGYYDYWGAQAGDRTQGWNATRIGNWQILALNSNCSSIGGCGRSSAQGQWLEAQLAASDAPCQLAYWHHPRFSSGLHGDTADVQPLWEILQEHQTDLVLSGHDHEYEAFAPMLADGTLSASGIRSYVIGTGGVDLRDFGIVRAGSETRIKKFGIGVIGLYENGWSAEFRATDGTTSTDGVTHECAVRSVAAPTVPAATVAAKSAQTGARVRAVSVGAARMLPRRSVQGLAITWRSSTKATCSVRRVVSTVDGVSRVNWRVVGNRRGSCRLRATNSGSASLLPANIGVFVRVR
ncbi:MAG: metallophosphoesterase [Thermoleophilia bacterium]